MDIFDLDIKEFEREIDELLGSMTDEELLETLKDIILGKVKYIGNSELVKDNMEV